MSMKNWRRLAVIFMWTNGVLGLFNIALIGISILLGLPPLLVFYLSALVSLVGWYAAYSVKKGCDIYEELASFSEQLGRK